MNERIKQLAEQANFRLDELPDNILIPLEKFAELIVQECSLTAGLMEHEGRKNIGSQILDNFGIEE
mgnify:CR=1 FL=1|jgi:hypothetical protein